MVNGTAVFRAAKMREYFETGEYFKQDEDVLSIIKKFKATSITLTDITKHFIKKHNAENMIDVTTARNIVRDSLKRLEAKELIIKVDKGRWQYNEVMGVK